MSHALLKGFRELMVGSAILGMSCSVANAGPLDTTFLCLVTKTENGPFKQDDIVTFDLPALKVGEPCRQVRVSSVKRRLSWMRLCAMPFTEAQLPENRKFREQMKLTMDSLQSFSGDIQDGDNRKEDNVHINVRDAQGSTTMRAALFCRNQGIGD